MLLDISEVLPPSRCNELALNQIIQSMFPTSQLCLYVYCCILIRCVSMTETEKKTDEGNEACKGKKKAKGPADI